MNTLLVWVLLASVATSSQNRASWVVDTSATQQDCLRILTALQKTWEYEQRGTRYTDVRGQCIPYTKVVTK